MKSPILPIVLALLALGLCLIAACASQQQLDIGHELAAASVAATDVNSPGGAQITPEEQETLAGIYQRLKGAEGLDWSAVGGSVLASLALIFPALRYLPNSLIVGKQEALALDKAAGFPPKA